jgi:hypothetical protein
MKDHSQGSQQASPKTQRPLAHQTQSSPTGPTSAAANYAGPLNPQTLRPDDVLQLQRTIGNRAVNRLLGQKQSHRPLQTKPAAIQRFTQQEGLRISNDRRAVVDAATGKLYVKVGLETIVNDQMGAATVGKGGSKGQGEGSFIRFVPGNQRQVDADTYVEMIPKLQFPKGLVEQKAMAASEDPTFRSKNYWARTCMVNQEGRKDDKGVIMHPADPTQKMATPSDCETLSALAQGSPTKGARQVSYMDPARGRPGAVPAQEKDYGTMGFGAVNAGETLANEMLARTIMPFIHQPANDRFLTAYHKTLLPKDIEIKAVTWYMAADGILDCQERHAGILGDHEPIWELLMGHTDNEATAFGELVKSQGENINLRAVLTFLHSPAAAHFITDYHRQIPENIKAISPKQSFVIDPDGIINYGQAIEARPTAYGLKAQQLYWNMSDEGRAVFDQQHGINQAAAPTAGQAYMIVKSADAPGFKPIAPGREAEYDLMDQEIQQTMSTWSFHWATVVLDLGDDRVTYEVDADEALRNVKRATHKIVGDEQAQAQDAKFHMYSVRDPGHTFQTEEMSKNVFGNKALVFTIQAK